jgi:cytoskeleton protein RodZ
VNDELQPGTGSAGGEGSEPRTEETVGEMLLAARERAGASLEQIAQDTRIPVSTLRYLETDNFEAIPARVYAKGFLRTYATALGLDAQQALNKYEVQTGQTHRSRGDLWEIEEQTVEERLPRTRLLRRLLLPAVLLVIIVIVLLRLFAGGEEAQPPPALPDTIPSAVPPATGGAATEEDSTAAEHDLPGQEQPGQTHSGQKEPSAADLSESAPMQLRIVATDHDTTWFDVVVYSRTETGLDSLTRDFILLPGGVETLRSNEAFLLRTVGNAGGFRLELDERALPLLGERGRVRRNVRITRAGISGG